MANYYETFRSNAFRVKDIDALKAELDAVNYDCEIAIEQDGSIIILSDSEQMFYHEHYDYETDEEYHWDWEYELPKHLEENSIAVFQVIGQEKLRYLTGYAVAIGSNGVIKSINLGDIYSGLPEGTPTAEF